MKPYYDDGNGIVIYHGDCRGVLPVLAFSVVVSDPPYGCRATTGWGGKYDSFEIEGDADLELRDWLVAAWGGPMILFGSPKLARPAGARAVLIWRKGTHTGMGDLSFPWKPDFEEVYIFGGGFSGRRTSSVLMYNARTDSGRLHPTEKPESLMEELVSKCPPGVVLDPFMGSGTTLRAAKNLNRQAIGIEIEERYCEIAVRRLSQSVFQWNE